MVNFDGLVGGIPLNTGLDVLFLRGVVVLGEAEGAGVRFNFDLLDSNILNLAIIIGVLVYFGRGVVGNILQERRSRIEKAVRDAEDRKQKAAAALAEAQQNLAQAEAEAVRIRENAEKSAERISAEILAESEAELARMQQSASQDITAQQERVTRELQARIAALALEKAEAQLKSSLSDSAQGQLIDRSIQYLGGQA